MPHDWDETYGDEPMWSGNPNQALVTEVADLVPGRVIDVGCGEGADAIWLAQHGWHVTGLDPSAKALARARSAAQEAGVEVEWVHAGIEDAPPAVYDLVSACYPALLTGTEERLIERVAPGGTLLFVHHADIDRDRALEHGVDPDDFVRTDEMLAAIPTGWIVERHERRDRAVTHGAGAHHHADLVVRARRGNA